MRRSFLVRLLARSETDAALGDQPARIAWGLPRPGASRQASVNNGVGVMQTAHSMQKSKHNRNSQTMNVIQDSSGKEARIASRAMRRTWDVQGGVAFLTPLAPSSEGGRTIV